MSSEASQLATRAAEGLGPGAVLVTMVPSTTVVLSLFALSASALYPWAKPPLGKNGLPVQPGLPSILRNAQDLGGIGIGLAVLAVICLSVLLRGFQRMAVQLLEGYWQALWIPGRLEAGAIERHTRRKTLNQLRAESEENINTDASAAALRNFHRARTRMQRQKKRARSTVSQYPPATSEILPTRLGNVLRRSERTAGERYGLDTLITYPRLYPFLSDPVLANLNAQFDALATSCTFVFVFGADAALASPLLTRGDRWTAVPLVASLLVVLSYLAAVNAAKGLSLRLAVAYDLHRFDMLRGLHLTLPPTAELEFAQNKKTSAHLANHEEAPRVNWRYVHDPTSTDPTKPAM